MTAEELITRLRKAGCRVFVHQGTANVVTGDQKIAMDLVRRRARMAQYTRNPAGVRDLGEQAIVEYDITLRPGMEGVTGSGGEPVTLSDLVEAAQ